MGLQGPDTSALTDPGLQLEVAVARPALNHVHQNPDRILTQFLLGLNQSGQRRHKVGRHIDAIDGYHRAVLRHPFAMIMQGSGLPGLDHAEAIAKLETDGTVILNSFCLGRFWEIGPQKRLYIPAPLLREGENTLIIVETEGKTGKVFLQDEPDLG